MSNSRGYVPDQTAENAYSYYYLSAWESKEKETP